jgi:hypothetical protein
VRLLAEIGDEAVVLLLELLLANQLGRSFWISAISYAAPAAGR